MQITLNHIRINYDVFGRGPAVLFVSDQPHDAQLWNSLAGPLIAANYRVVLAEVDSNTCKEAASTAIIRLLNSLGIGRAALCGVERNELMNRLLQDYPQRIACTYEATGPGQTDSHDLSATDPGKIETTNRQLLEMLNGFVPRKVKRSGSQMASAA